MKWINLFLKPLLWLAIICYGLFLPAKDLPVKPLLQIPHFDKIVHFGLFFVFSLLLFRPFKKLNTKYLLWAPVTALIFGILLESVQHTLSASRSSNIYDLLANTGGILVSILAFRAFVLNRKWEKLF